jgi:selenocysteine lyase/cysteine desulfurase
MTDISNPANQCALVLVHIKGTDPAKVSSWLYDKHRILTVTIAHDDFKGQRIAPSVYTTRQDMERFADAMEAVAKGTVKLD